MTLASCMLRRHLALDLGQFRHLWKVGKIEKTRNGTVDDTAQVCPDFVGVNLRQSWAALQMGGLPGMFCSNVLTEGIIRPWCLRMFDRVMPSYS